MMSKGNTRKGYTQAIFNLETGKLFAAELILAAIAIGVYFTSWYGFGAALLTLSIFSYLRSTGFILAIVLSCLWSALAAANACIFQGVNFFQESFVQSALTLFSTPASCMLGIIFFVIGLQFHLTGIEWARDILDPIGRNMPKIPGFTK